MEHTKAMLAIIRGKRREGYKLFNKSIALGQKASRAYYKADVLIQVYRRLRDKGHDKPAKILPDRVFELKDKAERLKSLTHVKMGEANKLWDEAREVEERWGIEVHLDKVLSCFKNWAEAV